MSKIRMDFRLKDLYALKHALQETIARKQERINLYNELISDEDMEKEYNDILIQVNLEQLVNDIEHENKITEYISNKINNIIPN